MNTAFREELEALTLRREGPCVSIYMPTHRAGMDVEQDPIRLSNLGRDVERALISQGMRSAEARQFLDPIRELERDSFFWRRQGDGLALFLSPEFFRSYRLPIRFEELQVVGDRFHVKPLFPVMSDDGRFLVLALSQDQVRLLECTRHGVREMELEGVPKNMDEALRFDDPEAQTRFHTITAAPNPTGRGSPMYHGQVVGIDDTKLNLWRYMLRINDGLHGYLQKENAPLVIAGVDYLLPIFKDANSYGHLFDAGITGNPERMSAQELRDEGWALVQPYFHRAQEEARGKFGELTGTGLTSDDIVEIVPAAYNGRVETLFVPRSGVKWGAFDPATNTATVHEEARQGDDDLFDIAAVQTFLHRGMVYAVSAEEVPGRGEIAATLRY